jgi:hypothetical protein
VWGVLLRKAQEQLFDGFLGVPKIHVKNLIA